MLRHIYAQRTWAQEVIIVLCFHWKMNKYVFIERISHVCQAFRVGRKRKHRVGEWMWKFYRRTPVFVIISDIVKD